MFQLLSTATTQPDIATGGTMVVLTASVMKFLDWWGKRKDSSEAAGITHIKALIDIEKIERKKLEKKITLLEKKNEEDNEKYIECVKDCATYKARWEEHTRTIQSYQVENKELKLKLSAQLKL